MLATFTWRMPAIARCTRSWRWVGIISNTPMVLTLASGNGDIGGTLDEPIGVAVDAAGNVYVADTINSAVKEIAAVNGSIPASPTITTLGSGFSYPEGVAADSAGNVYVADNGNSAVKEIVAVNGSIPPIRRS